MRRQEYLLLRERDSSEKDIDTSRHCDVLLDRVVVKTLSPVAIAHMQHVLPVGDRLSLDSPGLYRLTARHGFSL